ENFERRTEALLELLVTKAEREPQAGRFYHRRTPAHRHTPADFKTDLERRLAAARCRGRRCGAPLRAGEAVPWLRPERHSRARRAPNPQHYFLQRWLSWRATHRVQLHTPEHARAPRGCGPRCATCRRRSPGSGPCRRVATDRRRRCQAWRGW